MQCWFYSMGKTIFAANIVFKAQRKSLVVIGQFRKKFILSRREWDSECPVTKSWTAAWSAANCEAPEQSGLLPLPARTLQPLPSSFVRPSKSKRSQQLQS